MLQYYHGLIYLLYKVICIFICQEVLNEHTIYNPLQLDRLYYTDRTNDQQSPRQTAPTPQ